MVSPFECDPVTWEIRAATLRGHPIRTAMELKIEIVCTEEVQISLQLTPTCTHFAFLFPPSQYDFHVKRLAAVVLRGLAF